MRAWDELGIQVKPHFATAYPGSMWFTEYRDKILEQYKGLGAKMGLTDDLEAYIVDLGDASRVSGIISKNFNAVELVGLREMMLHRQYDKIDQYEKEWRQKHNILEGEPSTLEIVISVNEFVGFFFSWSQLNEIIDINRSIIIFFILHLF